jgi:ADP-heptose:LPS heptosyltransferase
LKKLFRKSQRRILVVRPDRIGDVVLSTPIYHTLKKSFPGSFLGALVSPATRPLLASNPIIDVILTDGPVERGSDGDNFLGKAREIRSYKFDTALLLMPTKRLAYMLFLAGIPRRVGVGHILYEIITLMRGVSRRKYDPLRHESDYMLDLARKIGATDIWTTPEIFLTQEEKDIAREYLKEKGFTADRKIVGIHPGSGRSAPNWEVERYVELAEKISLSGDQVLITGAETEKQHENFFVAVHAPGIKTSIGELSLREMAGVISQLGMFISGSTGPMHIAAALGTPTLSMFCPLTACSPKLWGPVGNSAMVVTPDDNFCLTKCPGDPHICTFGRGDDGITVGTLLAAHNKLMVLNP